MEHIDFTLILPAAWVLSLAIMAIHGIQKRRLAARIVARVCGEY